MTRAWNGQGTPSRGEAYLDQDGQMAVLLDEHNDVLVGQLVELLAADCLPVLTFSNSTEISPIEVSNG